MVKNTPAGYGEEELRSGEERTCGAWYVGGDATYGLLQICYNGAFFLHGRGGI